MNKKIITGLIALMGISILGIIIIQLVWMNNAIRVKNELFDRSVNEALTSTTNRLETIQDFRLINHFAFGDTTHYDGNVPPPPAPPTVFPFPPRSSRNPAAHKQLLSNRKSVVVRAKKNSGNLQYQITASHDSIHSKQDEIIVIHGDSLVTNLNLAYAQGINKIDSIVSHQLKASADSTGKLKRRMEIKTHQLQGVANKVVREISMWEEDVPIDRVIEVLQNELKNRNIPIHFELGIIKDSLLAATTAKADTLLLRKSDYKTNLYPNGIFRKNAFISVYFPGKDTFIYETLNWLLIISLVFSVIVLLTFALSVHFILKQKKISEMKSDFINNMTHEFKTPIATISVAADSIINQRIIEDPSRIRYFVEMIKKENIRMNRQVEDILTIARLDKKEFEFKWEAINLHDVIDDAIKSIALQVEKKEGAIITNFQAVNPVATSDAAHFANLIYNLLDNANKYSVQAPEIKISTQNNSKGVVIVVEDKGIGMSKAVQSRIFERFYRQTSGNVHNVKGFGLGLSYVKAVIEANKGSISVQSEPGKGSRFEVFIPFIRE